MKFRFAMLMAASFATSFLHAQEDARALNAVKINLAGLFVKNYTIQAERVINKRLSVAVSYRTMPKSAMPFKDVITNAVDNDPDATRIIETAQVSNTAITPEVRIYTGKGYGQGFYIAPFYRYAKFDATDMKLEYSGGLPQTRSLFLVGNTKTHTGGFMLGAQWAIGKWVSLDWWILGPHFGANKGVINATPDKTLNSLEQQEIKNKLEDMDFPLMEKTVEVSANNVRMNIDGPWGGVRAGVSVGVRF